MNQALPAATPEERSSFRFGLWALLLNLLCGCFPVAIVLGILAITNHNKAKARAAADPANYTAPAATGMVLGIIAMAWTVFALIYIGILSAIAIPALLGQRGRVQDKAAISHMTGRVGDLVDQYDKLREAQTPLPGIPERLESQLRSQHGIDRNPWNPALPPYNFHIQVVQGLDREGVLRFAESQATTLGQPLFVIELPSDQQPGYLAGAVRVKIPLRGSEVSSKVAALD